MNKVLSWLDNFWYHYKWHVIVILFVAVFLFVSIGQMVSKEKVDVYILYAGPTAFFASEIYEMQDAFKTIMPDLNNDGKKIVQFVDITLLTEAQIKANMEKAEAESVEYKPDLKYLSDAQKKLDIQLKAGDAYLLMLDPQIYAQDYSMGIYETLETLGIKTEFAYDDSSFYFKKTDFGQCVSIFDKIPDDTLMCFRKKTVVGESKGKRENKKYENQLVLMKEILAFENTSEE